MRTFAHTLPSPQRLAALALAMASTCVAAAASDAIPAHKRQCRQLSSLTYPDADRAHAAAPAQCQSVGLYYGIGSPKDYAQARQCALAAGESDQPFQEHHGVLMMVYANGLGVARDFALARKAACDAGGAPAEIEARLEHLKDMEEGRRGANAVIDICDDITSGYMGGWCTSIAADLEEQTRGAAFANLTASWRPQEKQAFARLERRAMQFIDERSGEEVDRTGTLRAAFTIKEQARQVKDLRASVAAFERGALPRHTQADLDRLDAEMNAVYQRLRRMPEPQFSTIRFAGIQKTQRAWLAYRDAWVDFGKIRYPSVPDSAWKAYFTHKRTAMLKKLVEQ